jgi:hypothetical protein
LIFIIGKYLADHQDPVSLKIGNLTERTTLRLINLISGNRATVFKKGSPIETLLVFLKKMNQ